MTLLTLQPVVPRGGVIPGSRGETEAQGEEGTYPGWTARPGSGRVTSGCRWPGPELGATRSPPEGAGGNGEDRGQVRLACVRRAGHIGLDRQTVVRHAKTPPWPGPGVWTWHCGTGVRTSVLSREMAP